MQRAISVLAASIVVLGLAGCATGPTTTGTRSASAAGPGPSGTITVYAAASLTDVFTTIADEFEKQNPDAKVTFNFAGSSDLVAQLTEGAPADALATADEKNMAAAATAKLLSGPAEVFATNTLEIVVPAGNPAKVTLLADLARPDVKTVICAPQVPCGAAAAKATAAAGVTLTPVSEESSVTDVLGKVSSGEADAGLVYATDVRRAGSTVEGVPFPESSAAVNRYPIASLSGSADPELAKAFVAFVLGDSGRAALNAAGFGAP